MSQGAYFAHEVKKLREALAPSFARFSIDPAHLAAGRTLAANADVYPFLVADQIEGDDIVLGGDGKTITLTPGLYEFAVNYRMSWAGSDGSNAIIYLDGVDGINGTLEQTYLGGVDGIHGSPCAVVPIPVEAEVQFNWEVQGGPAMGDLYSFVVTRRGDL